MGAKRSIKKSNTRTNVDATVNLEAIQRRFTELEIKTPNDLNLIRKW